ncbi:MAG: O-antigen ligase family protein [Candidatus Cloacimonetes bacterium]|nr:O-antigen ligase family protein [Candidatus Cloacimonadota bacterium]
MDKMMERVAKDGILSPRKLLWALLLLLAFCEFYQFSYFVSTLLTLVLIPVSMAWLGFFPHTPLVLKREYEPVLFLLFWFAYSLFSYVWAVDRTLALEYCLLVFRYLALFMIFSAAFRDRRLLKRFHLFLTGIFCLYIITAIIEVLTLKHLPSSRMYGRNYFIPTGPFYGENILAAFMMLLFPFILFLSKLYERRLVKVFSSLFVLLFLVVITLQGARIGMLAIGAVLLWYFAFHSRAKTIILILLAVILFSYAVHLYFPSATAFVWKIFKREVLSFGSERETATMSSIKIRKQLFVETWDMASNSGLMGVGGGNFEHYMDTDRQYRTASILNAHNWWLELLGNFGILILAGFAYIYLKWLYLLYLRFQRSEGRERYLALMYLISLVLFVASSALPSSIRWIHLIWIYFAAVNSFCYTDKLL